MQPSTQFTNPNDALRKFSNVDLVKQIAVAASVGGSRGGGGTGEGGISTRRGCPWIVFEIIARCQCVAELTACACRH